MILAEEVSYLKKKKQPRSLLYFYDTLCLFFLATHKIAQELMDDSENTDSSMSSEVLQKTKRKAAAPARLQNGAESDAIDSAINIEPPPAKLRGCNNF